MFKTIGIIAEYNPFHKGHAYQIKKAKELTGASCALAIMSGDFVQRGGPAVFDKYARTRMALLGGADLVLELPSYYACSSAEFFARGAVGILDALNALDFLCFGSESGNLKNIEDCAEFLQKEPPAYQKLLKAFLKEGDSFPAARKKALSGFLREKEIPEDFLDSPNHILGVEYCKALRALKSPLCPVTLKREGSGYHDKGLEGPFSSASAIRAGLCLGEGEQKDLSLILQSLPEKTGTFLSELLLTEKPVTEEDFSLLLKYRLMSCAPKSLSSFADVSPGLAGRIARSLNHCSSFSQFALLLKTKELTYSRICRALLHILLSIEPEDCAAAPSYARILGFQRKSAPLLRRIQDNSRIPVLTKASDYKRLLSPQAGRLFEKDLFASNLYGSVREAKSGVPFKNDLLYPPVIL